MFDDIQRLARALGPRYRVGRLIGRGGAAHVYGADDLLCHRRVAVKLLRSELASSLSADRFRAEMRVAARLQHPNIVPIHATGEVDGLPYYVMPFIEGEALRERLERAKRLSIEEVLRITADVARALDFAHRRQVVHRDIKPENVMLRPDGYVKVLDFGLAKLTATDRAADATAVLQTAPGMVMGTMYYMSPEQLSGAAVDARSDMFSFGVVVYELLTGSTPVRRATIAGTPLSEILRLVRENTTVPAGWRTAAELARPRGLIFSLVSCTTLTVPSRSCHTSASVSHGMVHSAASQ